MNAPDPMPKKPSPEHGVPPQMSRRAHGERKNETSGCATVRTRRLSRPSRSFGSWNESLCAYTLLEKTMGKPRDDKEMIRTQHRISPETSQT
jgi:hypothetical protein